MQHAGDDHTFLDLNAKGLREFGRQVVGLHADPTARDQPILHNALHHQLGGGHGNGKPDAHAAARSRINGRIDAQQIAIGVHQRTARIARIDGGVGLDEILERVDAELIASQRADDAPGDGLSDAKRVADGQHLVPHLQCVGVAQHNDRQAVQVDLQNCQVSVRIGPDHRGRRAAAVVEDNLDLIGTLHHMVVGQDITVGTDDYPAAQTDLRLIALIAKKELKPGIIVAQISLGCFAGVDTDHRGR